MFTKFEIYFIYRVGAASPFAWASSSFFLVRFIATIHKYRKVKTNKVYRNMHNSISVSCVTEQKLSESEMHKKAVSTVLLDEKIIN